MNDDARDKLLAAPAGHLENPSRAFVMVPREVFFASHPLSPTQTKEPASKREALLDLFAQAAWEDLPDRRRGELLAGTRWLAERWRWARTRARRFLEELEASGTIRWTRGTRTGDPSRILIVGYATLTASRTPDEVGRKAGPPSWPTSVAHLPPNEYAEEPDIVAHLYGPPSWPAMKEVTATFTGKKKEDGFRGRERVVDDAEYFARLALESMADAPEPEPEKDETSRARKRCGVCRSPIGPTAELCGRCQYAPVEAAR